MFSVLASSYRLGLVLVSCLNKIGTLQNYNGDGKGNVKKAIKIMSKTTTVHMHLTFLYISLLSLQK